jgi:hypothetical protein
MPNIGTEGGAVEAVRSSGSGSGGAEVRAVVRDDGCCAMMDAMAKRSEMLGRDVLLLFFIVMVAAAVYYWLMRENQ